MQFLAPLWLALAGAAAVPLLLHLLRRRTGVRVAFPAARYLARAEQEHSARVRLRNWLLMALRVLALLLVAFAAARPLAGGRVGARPPAAIAVVLDNSLSTSAVDDGQPVLDALRVQAQAALARATARDRVWLLTADGAVTGPTAAAARAAARDARPASGAGDLPGAAARAATLVTGAGLGAGAVIVVTDAQATAWPAPSTRDGASVPAAGRRLRVAAVAPDRRAPPDRAVLDAVPVPARWSPAGEVRGLATGAGGWQAALVDADGREAARARGLADSAEGGRLRVTLRPAARGWLAGAVWVDPDEWRGSDARHFAVFAGEPPAATADASAGPFAAAALGTLVGAGRARAGAGARIAEPTGAQRLPALLVAPNDGARLGAANQALARLGVPWRFGALVAAPARAELRDPSVSGDADRSGAAAAPMEVARRWRLEPAGRLGDVDTLATAGGEPWAVAGDGYVLLASPLDPAWTAFPVRAPFVPWVDAVLARALSAGGSAQRAVPGARVRAPSGADTLVGPLLAEGPSGRAVPSVPVRAAALTAPARAGVYLWRAAGASIGALVVDPEPAELALDRLAPGALAQRVGAAAGMAPGDGTRAFRDGAAAADAVLDDAGARPAAGFFAAAALLALAAEALAGSPLGARLSARAGARRVRTRPATAP